MTVFQNDRITFVCSIEHDEDIDTIWNVNGTDFWFKVRDSIMTDRKGRNNRTFDYFWKLQAKESLNNSRIQCKYTHINIPSWRYICSKNATLTIQGVFIMHII